MELLELLENSFLGEQQEAEPIPSAVHRPTAGTYRADGETPSLRCDYSTCCLPTTPWDSPGMVCGSQRLKGEDFYVITGLWEGIRFPSLEKRSLSI